MDLFDLFVVLAAAAAGVGGYRLGFFTRVLSWVGLAGGVYLAITVLPSVVRAAGLPTPVARLVLAVVVLVGCAMVGQAAGMMLGGRLHAVLPLGPLRSLDRAVGAAVGAAGVLAALWLLLPAISSVSGWPARETRSSTISRWMSANLPAPPDTLESLRQLVSSSDIPQVFAALRPSQAVGPPPARDPLTATLTARVAASTVKVQGQACDRIQEGSGFAVAHDLVLTNAHVVAGEPAGATEVRLPSGRKLRATVVLYDPYRDVALLSVPGLGETPLTLAPGRTGMRAAVFGHPGGQDALAVQPAVVAQEITAVGEDLYNTRRVSRSVYVLAAALAPGDSGGALVDRHGDVVGVAFAIALDRSHTAYALTASELEADLSAQRHPSGVSTEACLAG